MFTELLNKFIQRMTFSPYPTLCYLLKKQASGLWHGCLLACMLESKMWSLNVKYNNHFQSVHG